MNLTLAAATVGISKRTIYDWIRCGLLPYTEPQPWRRQVHLADVLRVKQQIYRKPRPS